MTIEDLKERKLIIFEGIVGSKSYGTDTPTSDTDVKGVFVLPLEDLLGARYVEQVSDEKNDTVYYELGRFLELLTTNNPNILELLNLPEDCVLHKDPLFDEILEMKDRFITKACKNSFGGYAVEQIKKARGYNKKIVKKFDEKRKSVLDFCYVAFNQGSVPVLEFLEDNYPGWSQNDVGLVAVPHMRYTYGAYMTSYKTSPSLGFYPKGIVQDLENSNDVSLSEVPKEAKPDFVLQFNKDGYSTYCREYKEYWDWVKKRNQARFTDNMLHGKGYDGKNLAHCHRLLDMAIEIGEGKGIKVRRENREELLAIRRGEFEYEEIVAEAEKKIQRMEEVFASSDLPETVSKDFVHHFLVELRKKRYNL